MPCTGTHRLHRKWRGGEISNLNPTCKITAPANGSKAALSSDLLITGVAADKDGTIEKLTLTIGGKTIASVTSAPFTYTLPATDLTVGTLIIKLQVEDNSKATASDQITVTIEANPIPENIAPVCSITAPCNGTSVTANEPLTITATGSDEDGTIEKVILTINDQIVTSVTTLPVNYIVPAEQVVAGAMKIKLTVEDNKQASAKSEVSVTVIPKADEGTMVDARDGKSYKILTLGEQVWMAENLAYLPQVHGIAEGSDVAGSAEMPFYYVYDYDGNDVAAAKATQNYADKAVLYNWYAAIQGKKADAGDPEANPSSIQGACPDGWHLPSKDEWGQLCEWVGENIEDSIVKDWEGNETFAKNISGALRSTSGWPSYSDPDMPDLAKGGLDLFGFCIQTYGAKFPKGAGFFYIDTQANYWCTDFKSDSYGDNGGYIAVSYIDYAIRQGFADGNRGISIRCVKN